MKKTLQSIIIIILLFQYSCSNEEINTTHIKLLKKQIVNINNNVYFIVEFIYNETNLTQLIFKDGNEQITKKIEIDYNSQQLPTLINEFDENNTLLKYILIEYNNTQISNYTIYYLLNNTATKYIVNYGVNKISKDIYSGDFNNQDTFKGTKEYTIDINNNIIEIVKNSYTITYTYDNYNNPHINTTSKNILNILDRLNVSVLNYGTTNNSLSFEYVEGSIIDHIDLNYTYDSDNYPIKLQEVSTEFGNGPFTEFIYY